MAPQMNFTPDEIAYLNGRFGKPQQILYKFIEESMAKTESLTAVVFSGFYHTKPVGQGRSRSTASGHHYTPAKTRKAQTDLAYWMKVEYWPGTPAGHRTMHTKIPPTDKPVILSLKFGFTKPKTNKKPHHTQKPDLSNLIKLVEDAGNGILWVDDSQIIQLNCEKFWAEEEGIEITVEVVG